MARSVTPVHLRRHVQGSSVLGRERTLLRHRWIGSPGSAMMVLHPARRRALILLHILWPTFALVLLIFVVWSVLLAQRVRHLRATPPRAEDLATRSGAQRYFEPIEMPANNLSNLFEIPVLFFALVPLLMGTQLAWVFVILRAVHSWIHIGPRNVRARAQVYIASTAVLAAMWIGFFIDFASAAAVYASAVAQP
jgi:hypothetical protein